MHISLHMHTHIYVAICYIYIYEYVTIFFEGFSLFVLGMSFHIKKNRNIIVLRRNLQLDIQVENLHTLSFTIILNGKLTDCKKTKMFFLNLSAALTLGVL